MEILKIENLALDFTRDGERISALRGVNLSLQKGEILAVVGESGCGKSVMTKAILGILPSNASFRSGSIVYSGKDLLSQKEGELEKIRGAEISLVPQDPFTALDPIMKIGEQICESMQGIPKVERRARALKLLLDVGIKDAERVFFEYPFRLSGGMRQRIAIAIALAKRAKLLICDEPTTALDVTIEAQILDLIKSIQKEYELSIIFITHDLGVVAKIADRVAVMYAGEIVEFGGVFDIFYNPKHPYTWALMSALPGAGDELVPIRGSVPDMRYPPRGDAFARRSDYAMRIDYILNAPTFSVGEGHFVKSWLYHQDAPKAEMPTRLRRRIERMRQGEDVWEK